MPVLTERPPAHQSGAGLVTATARLLHGLVHADEAQTVWHADGFTHRLHGHAQRIRVEGPLLLDGAPTYWMSFETEVLRGVPQVAPLTGALASSLCWEDCLFTIAEDAGRLVYRARTWFREATAERLARELAERAVTAHALAASRSDRLAWWLRDRLPGAYGVEPARRSGRGSPEPAASSSVSLLETYAARGREPLSAEEDPGLEAFGQRCGEVGLRVRYREQSSALYVGGTEAGQAFDLSLKLVDSQPVFGRGLFALLILPLEPDVPAVEVGALAGELNAAEWTARSRLNSTGAWVVRGSGLPGRHDLAYVSFVPRAYLSSTAAMEAFADMMARVRWYCGVRAATSDG